LPCMWEREKLKMTTEVLAPGTRWMVVPFSEGEKITETGVG
jgi:hypothetical protein